MMLKKIILQVSLATLLPTLVLAAKVPSAQKILEDMTLTYSQVPYMKNSFDRKEVSQLLGTEKKTTGDIEYSLKKIRINFKRGTKALFIRGEKEFWHVGEDGEVLTGAVTKAVPNIFVSIFSDPKIWKTLGTKHISVPEKNIANIEVDPNGKFPNVEKMQLKIDTSKRTLLELSYIDDIGNSTEIIFNSNRFYGKSFIKSKADRFIYKIKKTDKVTKI
jgi:hypothetical protein